MRKRTCTRIGVVLAITLMTGCATTQSKMAEHEWDATPPTQIDSTPATDGAIYHADQGVELFNDARAHRVGDILTITLEENTQASKSASTSTDKKDQTNFAAPTILGHTLKVGGKAATIATNGQRSFAGDGSSSQSNQLTGSITVTVAQRLSNGNLLIRGAKTVEINQGQETIRIQGIVRPEDILDDNSIPSTRVANAQIAYTGKGAMADANTQGWLSRFFNSKWMPL